MNFLFERDSLDVPMAGLGMPVTAQRYDIVRARDRRASLKHVLSTNRKSSTVVTSQLIHQLWPVAISLIHYSLWPSHLKWESNYRHVDFPQ